MDWHQVRQLEEDLKKVRIFLFEVARKQPEIELWGLGIVNRIVGADEALALRRTIETRLSDFQSSVRYAAPEIFQKVSELLDNSPLYHRAAEFSVSIELEKHSKHPSIVLPAAIQAIFRYLNIRRERILDNDEGVPLRKIIVDLDRLLSLVSLAEKYFWRRLEEDREVLKPSGVDLTVIGNHVERAIFLISNDSRLNSDDRERIEEYLLSAQAELVKDDPSWRKIIGALVIVSTILGGLAVAPEAVENVNAAVRYLLGTKFDGGPSSPPESLPSFSMTVET